MRAKAGGLPRNMAQKILAGRCDDPDLSGDLVRVRVDQVVITRRSALTGGIPTAAASGSKAGPGGRARGPHVAVETAVLYDTVCDGSARQSPSASHPLERQSTEPAGAASDFPLAALVGQGLVVGRAGIGFPASVHLERFAAPARLALTDDPRVSTTGGAGMLTLLASPKQLRDALQLGRVVLRPPQSLQVLLSGKLRPFVGARDLALEILGRGLAEMVRQVDAEHGAPVVIEFAGPSARLLAVADRAVLCSVAARVGASAALFVSDEKTEVYLRDQRRSKAHRALVSDAGAPCAGVVSVDMSTVDPMLMDASGEIRPVRDLEGAKVTQVVLGGDTGASLRDLMGAASLLKSKRVPPDLDLLLACPSRQVLEVMAQSKALADLLATGARLLEPDPRLLEGARHPPTGDGLSLRSYDGDPSRAAGFAVASAETLAFAVANGQVGDPRNFKRPVRITVPRTLPTEDVLVLRRQRGRAGKSQSALPSSPPRALPAQVNGWRGGLTLPLRPLAGLPEIGEASFGTLAESFPALSHIVRAAARGTPALRVVVAEHIPSSWVNLLASSGVLCLVAPAESLALLRSAEAIRIADTGRWGDSVPVSVGSQELSLRCPVLPEERSWIVGEACLSKLPSRP